MKRASQNLSYRSMIKSEFHELPKKVINGERMKNKRVLLGMSGGTDSSASAVILKEQGFELVGVTFIFSNLEKTNNLQIKDAKELARHLGFEHHVIDLRKEFNKKIIQRFIREYSEGKTPFPCAFCNPQLKFAQLFRLAEEWDCNFISTGHYVRIVQHNGIKYMAKGKDPEKDQSFFLWGLSKQVMEKLLFPLGDYSKNHIRNYARQKGFYKISKKKDSLGICFMEGKDYRKFLKYNGLHPKGGFFKDSFGRILGSHKGITNYTIGQRRGLGLNCNKPLFVTKIDAEKNEIILGDYDELFKRKIFLENTHFVVKVEVKGENEYIVKIRYRLQETPCTIQIFDENCAEINLLEPLAMVARGQTAVFYENDRVIGGGFIKDSE